MKIENVEIKNFCCLEFVEIPFDNLTVLIGRNGSGKSSILHAIQILFKKDAKITIEDFFNRETKNPIEIKATFVGFTREEKNEFRQYISNDKMIILKKITYNEETDNFNPEYFSFPSQIPKFSEIREITGARDQTKSYNALVSEGKFPDLTERANTVAKTLMLMENYEKEHPKLCEPMQMKLHSFRAKNVGGGTLDKFTRFVFLPAVKEASEEIEGKNSSIEQLLEITVLREMQSRSDIATFRNQMTRQIMKRFSPKKLGSLNPISDSISKRLDFYSPGATLSLHWDEAEPPQIDLPSIGYSVSEDGFSGAIDKKGHGLQRALILTLLEHLSRVSAVDEIAEEESEEKEGKFRIDTILAIEEPEIYLHPGRARYLSNILHKLVESDKEASTQVVYTTHSPYFVGLDRFDDIRVCRKLSDKTKNKPPHTSVSWFGLASANKILEEICGHTTSLSNPRDNFRIRSARVMSIIVNEGLFSDFVVLVEGISDLAVLWKVQEHLNANWDRRSISLIPVNNKANLIKPKIIFDGLSIPNYIVFDKDISDLDTTEKLLKLVGAENNVLPQIKIQDTWAYNDAKMEDELKRMLTEEIYEEIWGDIGKKLGSSGNWIRKNVEALSLFVEFVYEREMSLPHYEKIVKKVERYYKTSGKH